MKIVRAPLVGWLRRDEGSLVMIGPQVMVLSELATALLELADEPIEVTRLAPTLAMMLPPAPDVDVDAVVHQSVNDLLDAGLVRPA